MLAGAGPLEGIVVLNKLEQADVVPSEFTQAARTLASEFSSACGTTPLPPVVKVLAVPVATFTRFAAFMNAVVSPFTFVLLVPMCVPSVMKGARA